MVVSVFLLVFLCLSLGHLSLGHLSLGYPSLGVSLVAKHCSSFLGGPSEVGPHLFVLFPSACITLGLLVLPVTLKPYFLVQRALYLEVHS